MHLYISPQDITSTLKSWFTYQNEPLMFNTMLFCGLFLVFYLIYILTKEHRHFRNAYVVLFSLFFYYKAGNELVILLIGTTIVNYIISEFMDMAPTQQKRKLWLILVIIVDLGILGYFKYTNFFISNINTLFHQEISLRNIALPVGISFYTFQTMSYLIDLYKKEIKPAENLMDFMFFVCYFPQLVAGPIVRAKDFLPQMYTKLHLNRRDVSIALYLIMIGLIKKAIISDYISSNFVDRVFDAPNSYKPFENLLACYGYALQIYCDFSGYSDMAIGLALLMGFNLPENFRTPYKSGSITEFWKRWHISLSTWLKDYLYISMGGNRKGKIRTYINLMLTMLIGGLWHGAAWKFVAWGGLHGIALVLERFLKRYIKLPETRFVRFICVLFTFHFAVFCWIFFRAKSFAIAKNVIVNITQITTNSHFWDIIKGHQNVMILILIGYIFHFLPESATNKMKDLFNTTPLILKALLLAVIMWLVYTTASSGPQPFIYFQF